MSKLYDPTNEAHECIIDRNAYKKLKNPTDLIIEKARKEAMKNVYIPKSIKHLIALNEDSELDLIDNSIIKEENNEANNL